MKRFPGRSGAAALIMSGQRMVGRHFQRAGPLIPPIPLKAAVGCAAHSYPRVIGPDRDACPGRADGRLFLQPQTGRLLRSIADPSAGCRPFSAFRGFKEALHATQRCWRDARSAPRLERKLLFLPSLRPLRMASGGRNRTLSCSAAAWTPRQAIERRWPRPSSCCEHGISDDFIALSCGDPAGRDDPTSPLVATIE
jgi:hypothetical protein